MPHRPRNPAIPSSRRAGLALLSLALLLVAGCGEDAPLPADGSLRGDYYGQEVWITYYAPDYQKYGRRTGRSREDAKKLAERLRDEVAAGADLGALAREYSNAPYGAADGYTGRLPQNPAQPTERDRAIASVPVGGLTPLVDFMGGFWFARRVSAVDAARLRQLQERLVHERRQFRSIAILYKGAWMQDPDAESSVKLSKEQAYAKAEAILARAESGEDFGALAREYSNDAESAQRDGLVTLLLPDRSRSSWIPCGTTQVPQEVLKAVYETPVGELCKRVIVSPRGIFLVKVEARREVR